MNWQIGYHGGSGSPTLQKGGTKQSLIALQFDVFAIFTVCVIDTCDIIVALVLVFQIIYCIHYFVIVVDAATLSNIVQFFILGRNHTNIRHNPIHLH